ncbi:MAG TPA: phenylacetate--CoA ligase family protein [Burkholderiales bacterium]|nr:phenylacetate--CoA ligase family protein [Burkholderiales bacterium]
MFSSGYYRSAPPWLQDWLLSARALGRKMARESGTFHGIRAELDRTQHWTREEAALVQAQRLTSVIRRAARHVPYYRDRFRTLGLDAEKMEFPRDLHRIPLLTKVEVRAAGRRLVADDAGKPMISGSTSGTTGSPVWFHQDLNAVTREHAFIWRHLRWAGLRPGDRRAWLRGEPIVPADRNDPPYWRRNYADNMLMLSSLHLSHRNAPRYLEALAEFDPVVLQAYPSSVSFLAAWMMEHGKRYAGRSLRTVVTSSEMFDPRQREQVATAFGCKVMDWYGLAERVAAIGMCERGSYHVMMDYGYVEFIPTEFEGLVEPVGTGFNNRAMPLLRYRCGDLVRLAPAGATCECGRHGPIVAEVIGRSDDFIKMPDGRRMAACLAGNMFRGVPGILEGQIQQECLDSLTIRVVPSQEYTEASEQALLSNARARLGANLACRVVVVDEIARTPRGKFKSVICSV